MRRTLLPLLLLAVLSLAAACAARQATAPTRATPSGTVEMFKMYARYGNRSGEWDILSPGFKERLSQQAGRQIDRADYMQARDMYRGDPRVQAAEKMLQTAIVVREEPLGPGRVRATIRTAGGPFAQSGQVTMVQLQSWKLKRAGQDEPWSGYVGDPLLAAAKQADGSYVITSNGKVLATVPADQVESYTTESSWYVDDLGGMERQFFQ